ncbi:DUF5994 family protein [Streptomyces sp. NPDC046197]|uniref:DUF5994 family protein n=1 Tax=Streptomyces sp. NPDC046197 TaxID=3154337 RepID=UPI0034089CE7
MTATIDRTITIELLSSAPARLSLTPPASAPGLLDGAWWPRSRDLLWEIPALTDALDARRGRITRVIVNPAHWPVIPRRVPVSGHIVQVGWFAAEQDPNKLILLSYTVGRLDLLVIPPEAEAAAPARLMAAAAVPGSLRTAGGLMADEAMSRDAAEVRSREEEWETDGGPPPAAGLLSSAPRR